jgi:L-seryl-tRNA(Ser) seleniumtransferase
MWFKRDHAAEWRLWESWLDHISKRVTAVEGVTAWVAQPTTPGECPDPCGLSNRMPSLHIRWDRDRFGLTGEEAARRLFETAPRIRVPLARGRIAPHETGLTIDPYMMAPGDERVVADRICALLKGPKRPPAPPPAVPAADLTGSWDVRIEYAAASSSHALHLRQRGNELEGVHQGDFVSRDASGTIDGDAVLVRSDYPESRGDRLRFTFSGKVAGDTMAGELDMGEYLKASWTATRHAGRRS